MEGHCSSTVAISISTASPGHWRCGGSENRHPLPGWLAIPDHPLSGRSEWVMRAARLAPLRRQWGESKQGQLDPIPTLSPPRSGCLREETQRVSPECKAQGHGVLTWLSTRSSVSVAFSRTAFSTAMSPVLLMKLDSMFRLWTLRFSRSMSATAWAVGTWVRIGGQFHR